MQASGYKLQPGDRAPPFKDLPATDGHTYSLDSFQDANVLVVVWHCNHCPYVQAYESRFIQVTKDYAPKGVAFVAINSNHAPDYPEDSFPKMVERAQRLAYPFPYLHDETQIIAEAYGAVCTPHVLVFEGQRKLAYQGRFDGLKDDPRKGNAQDLREALDDLLSDRPVRSPTTWAFGCGVKWGPDHFARERAVMG